ncbi:nicotinamidase-related amidase [Paraburkholderia sp. WC7.3g]|nr:isochorismatase family protein [Paraburkholderia podalyriae]
MPKAQDIAFLFLDFQIDVIPAAKTLPLERLQTSVGALATLARDFGAPAFISTIPTGAETKLIPELQVDGLSATMVTRNGPHLFGHAESAQHISALKRPVLVVGGVLTEIAVLNAVLGARNAGYEVHVMIDACGGWSERTQTAAIEQMRAAGAVISSTLTLSTSLLETFSSPDSAAVFKAIGALLG